MAEPFIYKTRIYYQDTDVGGVVYHSKYIDFAERARMELLIKENVPPSVLQEKYNAGLMVRSCNIVYYAPAKLEDEITIETQVAELKGATMVFKQTVYKDKVKLVAMDIVAVCVNLNYKPVRLPDDLRMKLEKYK